MIGQVGFILFSSKFEVKGMVGLMVLINKDEKKAIIEKFPKIHIVRTMKQRSKRHHYYMVEEPAAMRELRKLRGEIEPKTKRSRKKWGGNHSDRKTT